jgi:hypothetical protein
VIWISVIAAGLLLATVIAGWIYRDGSRRFDRTIEESSVLPAPDKEIDGGTGAPPTACPYRRGA